MGSSVVKHGIRVTLDSYFIVFVLYWDRVGGVLMTTKAQIQESSETATKPVKRRLRNVTVTMEEDVAKWARMEAARRDMSVSRLMSEIVIQEMSHGDDYEQAKQGFLAEMPLLKTDGKYPSREEAHDR